MPAVQEWLEEARRCDRAGDGEAARRAYRQALELEPRCDEAWLALVTSWARQGNWNEVHAVCLAALQELSDVRADGYAVSEETLGQLHYELAQAFSRQARPDDAILELKLATHYIPGHARAHYELGLVCWEEGRLEEATRYLARALTLKHDSPDALHAFRNALARYQAQAAQRFPGPVRERYEKGLALYRKQDFAGALPHFQAAFKAAPAHAEALCYMGLCQIALRDPVGLNSIEQAARLAPNNADILDHLARCYAGAGRLEEAARLYLHAVQVQPTHVGAYTGLSRLYQGQGRWSEALEALKRARYVDLDKTLDPQALLALCEGWVKAEPQNARAHYELATRYVAADNWPLAIAELSTALVGGYDQADVYVYLGLALIETKDWTKAAQSLKTAIARQPGQALWRMMLAFVHFAGLKEAQPALAECELAVQALDQAADPSAAALRRLVTQMMGKIKHPSRDDQPFWAGVRRQIKAEVSGGL